MKDEIFSPVHLRWHTPPKLTVSAETSWNYRPQWNELSDSARHIKEKQRNLLTPRSLFCHRSASRSQQDFHCFQNWDVSLRRVHSVWHRDGWACSFISLLSCRWECVYFGEECWPTGPLVRNVLSDMLTLAVLTNASWQSVSTGVMQIWVAPS